MGLWNWLYDIISFPGTLTVVTAFAAFVAWALYDKQRRDQRREAAKSVLSEIERAENRIPNLKKTLKSIQEGGTPDSMRLLDMDSWGKAQYLLAGKLPEDVIVIIGEFYTYCRLIDEALGFIDGVFAKNEAGVRDNGFRVNADYLVKMLDKFKSNPDNTPSIKADNDRLGAEIREKIDAFNNVFPTSYAYRPVKPTNDIKNYLDLLPQGLSQGRVGERLRLSKLGLFKRILAGQWFQP